MDDRSRLTIGPQPSFERSLTSLTYRYIHLKEISVHFIKRRPTSALRLILEDGAGVKQRSDIFKKYNVLHWNLDTYVRTHTMATLTIRLHLKISLRFAQVSVAFDPNKFGDDRVVSLKDSRRRFTIYFVCGRSQSLEDVTRFLDSQTRYDLVSKVPRLLKHHHLADLPPSTSDVPYVTIHRLNDDILLGIFDCYRLEEEHYWNRRLLWCKLSHVCQRWRHVIYGFASHLGMQIRCTNGTPVVDTLDHFPPLPLFVDYGFANAIMTEKDELGIYHALQLHDRVCHINLDFLPPSILHEVLVLMDKHFPILEHLSLSFSSTNEKSPTLPKAFLAPNLHHLALPGISPPRRLRMLTSTVSLVTLKLTNIETSSYFRPRVLVARLQSLPQLQRLSIDFSIPIPRPSTERELLGEQRAPVTLPSLKNLRFKGVGGYLESLVAQIGVPRLERLDITLFNQIAFALPHLYHLINTTERFKLPTAGVYLSYHGVDVSTADYNRSLWVGAPLHVRVTCKQLDWQIDCAAQICHELIPALSGVKRFTFDCFPYFHIPTELQNGAIDGTTWHELLRPFIGVTMLYIDPELMEELSRALQVDEVGSDPGFLPNLRSIHTEDNLFTSFINTRRVVGRPVEFSQQSQ